MDQEDAEYLFETLNRMKTKVIVTAEIDTNEKIYDVLARNNVSVITPLRDSDTEKVIGMFIVGQDRLMLFSEKEITALKTICDIIGIAVKNSELSRLDRAKDEFLSLASHQLRTPLTSMRGYGTMLLDGDFGNLNKGQMGAVKEIVNSSERLIFLVRDFLDISRLQAGNFRLDRTKTTLAKLLGEDIDRLQMIAAGHGVTLQYDMAAASDLPKLNIDREHIGEVMSNLIDNAIFYSPHGGVVTVKLARVDDAVEFRVEDHGIGVPRDEQSGLFTKFFRASNARTLRPDGTGIGLFLAKKVVAEHGGEMIFHSVEGKGSTFGFRLPIGRDD
jgi:signal transduction histidine kinase